MRNSRKQPRWEERRRALLKDETGTIFKDHSEKIRIALVFPNTYEIGMSNLGFQTVYALFNQHPDVVCERAFLPEPDDAPEMERTGAGLTTMESGTLLRDMDIIAFSVSFELDYLNILNILELAGLPFTSEERTEGDPLVIAGGPAMYINPEPVAAFLDAVCVGDGEELVPELMEAIHQIAFDSGEVVDRTDLLRKMMQIEGVYVPRFYRPVYAEDGTVDRMEAREDAAPLPVKRRITMNLGDYQVSSVIRTPNTEFSNTHLVEVSRGCARSCRFCFAGYGFRPVRYRKTEQVNELLAQGAMANNCDASVDDPTKNPNGPKTHGSYRGHGTKRDPTYGDARDTMAEQADDSPFEKVGLIGSSLSDNPWTTEIAKGFAEKGYRLNASSLRAETTGEELTQVLGSGGQRMLTLAPEAGTERLRKIIKKPMKEEAIMQAVANACAAGIKQIKFYFMCGLPGELDDDVLGIADLCKRVLALHKLDKLVISLNPFVPKPFTPFQWHPQETAKGFERKKKIVENAVKGLRGVAIRMESPRLSEIQAILSRGDRKVSDLLLSVHRHNGDWRQAIRDLEFDVDHHLRRERKREEFLPWDVLDLGLNKDYLWAEYQAGLAGEVNPKPFMNELGVLRTY
jgi:radical SAM superfamily enzyme YgiQ (UPF0313 family)